MILLTLFRFAFASAPRLHRLTSHHIVTRRPVLQKVRRRALNALRLLVNLRFQVLFHSPPGVLFTVPSRYFTLSVTWSYLALRDGPRSFRPDFSCPDVLRISARLPFLFAYKRFTSFAVSFQILRLSPILAFSRLLTPKMSPPSVWAPPISLATTLGITFVFFSFGYLDVSVPRVPLLYLSIQYNITRRYAR